MNLFKAVSTISLLTLASRITGLMRELLMASVFGASALTDAFNVAFRIPNLLRRLFAEGAFSQAFVPILAANRAQHGDASTRLLVDRVATLLTWALVFTCMLGVAAAPVLVWGMASGLPAQGFEAAVFMTRWMFPYIACMSLVSLAAGVLNTYQRFAVPAATPVLLNLAMIGAAWWGAPWFKSLGLEPIYALAGGVMLGGVLQLAVQVPALMKIGMLPRIGLSGQRIRQAWADPSAQSVLTLMLPALLGVGVAQISLLINTQIASYLTPGSVSWLSYADRLMEFPVALLGVALGVVLMPQLAAAKAGGDGRQYAAMIDWGLRLVVVLGLPCAVALLIFATPLVASLYHYGAFTARDVQQTSAALMGYGAGLLGLLAIKVLAPGYYASQNIKTPVRIAVVVLVITQLLNIALVPWLAHAGLALSIGLGALINALWLLLGLLKNGSYTPSPGWWRFGLQVGLASALLGGALWWVAQHLDWIALQAQWGGRLALLAAVVLGAALLYFGVLWASGVKLKPLLRPS
ncbi:MAG: murein biosynthesis integral membrane protein MurJ [Burkholderiaceae bacterium]